MTHGKLLALHEEVCAAAYANMNVKNSDYSPPDDALRTVGQFGRLGVLARISDKLGRLRTLVETDKVPSVRNEKEEDDVRETINYLVLYLALRKEATDDDQNKETFGVLLAPKAGE